MPVGQGAMGLETRRAGGRGAPTVEQSVPALAAYLAQSGSDDLTKTRALYRWIAGNIDYHVRGFRAGSHGDVSPEGVLRSRSSACEGYARLAEALGTAMGLQVQVRARAVQGLRLHVGPALRRPHEPRLGCPCVSTGNGGWWTPHGAPATSMRAPGSSGASKSTTSSPPPRSSSSIICRGTRAGSCSTGRSRRGSTRPADPPRRQRRGVLRRRAGRGGRRRRVREIRADRRVHRPAALRRPLKRSVAGDFTHWLERRERPNPSSALVAPPFGNGRAGLCWRGGLSGLSRARAARLTGSDES